MKHIVTILAIFLSLFTVKAQDSNILWQRTIGGSGEDKLWSMVSTNDGGFIMGGEFNSNISGEKTENSKGGKDYWVIKLNNLGNIEWQKTIGGSGDDILWSIIQTIDGGYILGGYSDLNISGDKTENSRGGFDYWVLKLNEFGSIDWQKTIGGDGIDRLRAIYETDTEDLMIGGESSSGISGDRIEPITGINDNWVIKINSTGSIIWQKAFGISNYQTLTTLSETSDGGSIFSGNVQTSNMNSFWVVKITSSGNLQWDKIIGGIGDDIHPKIAQTGLGYIITGASESNISGDKAENSQGGYDYWILKLDETGNIEWQNTIERF